MGVRGVLDMKSKGRDMESRYLGELSELKAIMTHFSGRKVFWFKWINQLITTTINGMQFTAKRVAL